MRLPRTPRPLATASHGTPARRARVRAVLPLALAAVVLAACGQKGPLVLPDSDASGVVIRGPDGAPVQQVSQPERREPAKRAPTVPAPSQSPPETAPRSTTPR